MVTCLQCRQALLTGRADKRFCSGRCRMQYHRRQKQPLDAQSDWRAQMGFALPIRFHPRPDLSEPQIKGFTCQIPQAWWQAQPELARLNAISSMLTELSVFTYWEGATGQKDPDPTADLDQPVEHLDISVLYQQALESVSEQLEELRQSEGRLGMLLRPHWAGLEADYTTFKRYVRSFVLQHQTEEVYVTQLDESFKVHLARWSAELGLLWLELEEQSR